MPPGVSGLLDSGSGASRVHNTKPSARGAPEATPRLNGLPPRQLCAAAMRMRPGAAIAVKAAPAPPTKRRRLKCPEVTRPCILPLAARLRLSNIFAGFYDILTPAIANEETERDHG
jgi:hypothetical protein